MFFKEIYKRYRTFWLTDSTGTRTRNLPMSIWKECCPMNSSLCTAVTAYWESGKTFNMRKEEEESISVRNAVYESCWIDLCQDLSLLFQRKKNWAHQRSPGYEKTGRVQVPGTTFYSVAPGVKDGGTSFTSFFLFVSDIVKYSKHTYLYCQKSTSALRFALKVNFISFLFFQHTETCYIFYPDLLIHYW